MGPYVGPIVHKGLINQWNFNDAVSPPITKKHVLLWHKKTASWLNTKQDSYWSLFPTTLCGRNLREIVKIAVYVFVFLMNQA